MLQQNLIYQAQQKFSAISTQLSACMKEQQMQISQIDSKNSKTLHKFQKTLEKLYLTVNKFSNLAIQTKLNMIEMISKQQYQYKIEMAEDLELPCYRNRLISIKFNLVKEEQIIHNVNNILIELQIWTYDNIPKKIQHNIHGQSICKGSQQAIIKKGHGCLNKIQIKEVSSHFPKGIFRFIIIPVDDNGISGNVENFEIKKEWIKPLIINNVIIKAKKFSDRHIPYFAKPDGTIVTQ